MVKVTNPRGDITIDGEVFANLAGDAATSCFGVKAMAAQGRDGGVFQLRRESMSKGVKAELGEGRERLPRAAHSRRPRRQPQHPLQQHHERGKL